MNADCLEHTKSHNRTKVRKNVIADINKAQGKPFSTIKTLRGESLIDFHHKLLYEVFPPFNGKIFDFSGWLARHGEKALHFYEHYLALFICNAILVEDFRLEGSEHEFTKNIMFPAFNRLKEKFGIQPLIVKLAPQDAEEHPLWWLYPQKVREIVEKYVI
jgi:hypothetical protein